MVGLRVERVSRRVMSMNDFYLQENNNVKQSSHVDNGDTEHDDTISLYVFGEEEQELASVAERNQGIVPYSQASKHHYADLPMGKSYVRIQQVDTCLLDWFPSYMYQSNTTGIISTCDMSILL